MSNVLHIQPDNRDDIIAIIPLPQPVNIRGRQVRALELRDAVAGSRAARAEYADSKRTEYAVTAALCAMTGYEAFELLPIGEEGLSRALMATVGLVEF